MDSQEFVKRNLPHGWIVLSFSKRIFLVLNACSSVTKLVLLRPRKGKGVRRKGERLSKSP
jgi:hypothetical protein